MFGLFLSKEVDQLLIIVKFDSHDAIDDANKSRMFNVIVQVFIDGRFLLDLRDIFQDGGTFLLSVFQKEEALLHLPFSVLHDLIADQ